MPQMVITYDDKINAIINKYKDRWAINAKYDTVIRIIEEFDKLQREEDKRKKEELKAQMEV